MCSFITKHQNPNIIVSAAPLRASRGREAFRKLLGRLPATGSLSLGHPRGGGGYTILDHTII